MQGALRASPVKQQRRQRFAARPFHFFGLPGSPVPLFPWPLKRGGGAPGGAGEFARLPTGFAKAGHAKIPGPKALRGVGVPGRGARAKGPTPPGAPTRCQLSGTAPCSVFKRRDRRRPRSSKVIGTYHEQTGSQPINRQRTSACICKGIPVAQSSAASPPVSLEADRERRRPPPLQASGSRFQSLVFPALGGRPRGSGVTRRLWGALLGISRRPATSQSVLNVRISPARFACLRRLHHPRHARGGRRRDQEMHVVGHT